MSPPVQTASGKWRGLHRKGIQGPEHKRDRRKREGGSRGPRHNLPLREVHAQKNQSKEEGEAARENVKGVRRSFRLLPLSENNSFWASKTGNAARRESVTCEPATSGVSGQVRPRGGIYIAFARFPRTGLMAALWNSFLRLVCHTAG